MADKKYSIEKVFKLIGADALMIKTKSHGSKECVEIDGYKVKRRSLRYATFYQKGCTCVVCGKKGTHFRLDPTDSPDASRRHFNLYAEDGTLITKDHILPKHWGGQDNVDNLQPMCKTCNEQKGSICEIEIEGITATDIQTGLVKQYIDLEQAVADMCTKLWLTTHNKLKRSTIVRKAVDVTLRVQHAIESGVPYANYIWKKEKFIAKGSPFNSIEK